MAFLTMRTTACTVRSPPYRATERRTARSQQRNEKEPPPEFSAATATACVTNQTTHTESVDRQTLQEAESCTLYDFWRDQHNFPFFPALFPTSFLRIISQRRCWRSSHPPSPILPVQAMGGLVSLLVLIMSPHHNPPSSMFMLVGKGVLSTSGWPSSGKINHVEKMCELHRFSSLCLMIGSLWSVYGCRRPR